MLIGTVSDMHGNLPDTSNWPKLDLFIIGGDIIPDYAVASDINQRKQIDFITNKLNPWIDKVQADQKVAIGGNHDHALTHKEISKTLPLNWLEDNYIVYKGFTVYGTPASYRPPTYPIDWSFGYTEADLATVYENIHQDTNILVSHTPPFGMMDLGWSGRDMQNFGAKALRNYFAQTPFPLPQLRLMITAHIHEWGGQRFDYTMGPARKRFTMLNAAVSVDYHPKQELRLIEL